MDENAPDSLARFFRDRGHEVHLVREELLLGTVDQLVAKRGDQLGAVVP